MTSPVLDLLAMPSPALIQGMTLCRWGRVVGELRRLTTVELVRPVDVIRRFVPQASDDDLASTAARLKDHAWELAGGTVSATQLMAWLYPGGPWAGVGTDEHLTRWLCWWAESAPDSVAGALAVTVGTGLALATSDERRSEGYRVESANDAIATLEDMAGLLPRSQRRGLLELGLITASVRSLLMARFRKRLVEGQVGPTFLIDDVTLGSQADVARAFRDRAMSRRTLDRREFEVLLRVLGPDAVEPLQHFLEVPDPGDVPHDPDGVLEWYRRTYLPWKLRYWQTDEPSRRLRVAELEGQFESWVLQMFADIQQRPMSEGLTAWARSHLLRSPNQDSEGPTLLVVTDGLAPGDIAVINRGLAQVSGLFQVTDDVVFTRLPTVTEFTKPAIVTGQLAVHLIEEPAGPLTGIDRVIDRLHGARNDDVVAWTHVQPDHDYHWTTKPEERSLRVANSLREIADGIARVVESVGPTTALRIIVTTDHGRYLGVSERTVRVPKGLEPHGRAAWGEGAPPNQPYLVEDDYVELNPTIFGLEANARYVIARGSAAFDTKSGSGGSEYLTHGGLSPEEVIIPWVEYRRRVSVIPLELVVSGSGEARKAGAISLSLTNPNGFTVRLLEMQIESPVAGLNGAGLITRIPVADLSVPGMGQYRNTAIPVAAWPFSEDQVVSVVLTYRLPSGQERRQTVDATLTTRSLYRPGLSLDDLDDFS